ncbi:anaphase promoting complex subunit cdc16 [Phytophthora boehmeriae]|uniref:Anaphase promoting complex subunit cdc16 n=1 Tax=Phytophthora boehmeriae TaxID=109152 RepID=A0A8T1X6I4_9STRA|nr:anaphase promoting complex subunit cdc16 [Phytophthora boehmeriae]
MAPPPTPARPPAPAIRGAWRQPSPVQTPECTTRTLAFDSAASSAAEDASARARKRRRRVAQSAAFINTRRPLDTEEEQREEQKQDDQEMAADNGSWDQIWADKAADGGVREASYYCSEQEQLEDNREALKPPLTGRRSLQKTEGRQETKKDAVVKRLRELVKKCGQQHHTGSALFYADKLVTMSPREPNDVLLFADACYMNREFHRAIHAIKNAKLVETNRPRGAAMPNHSMLRAYLLLGQCMLAIKQKEECLEMLNTVLPERERDVVVFAKKVQLAVIGDEYAKGINVVASLALLMGETYEAIGNRESATVYFRIALRCDVHCSEAFFHLFNKQMLSAQEEKELVASLDFSTDEMQLLDILYQTHVGKYDSMTSVEEKFIKIEQEFGLTDNLDLEFIRQASVICPSDPLVYNELGSVFYKQKNYPQAIEMFTKALQLCKGLPERLMESWEPTLFNLGYSYRKLRKFDQAIHYFQSALRLSPRNASILAALGFTYHMKGNLEEAIESYHAALAYSPEDTLAGSMITVAFEESLSAGSGSFPEFSDPVKNAPKTSGLTPMALTARRRAGLEDNTYLSRRLDQSYSSIERSRQSLACSSLDFSDDSSMMNVDE